LTLKPARKYDAFMAAKKKAEAKTPKLTQKSIIFLFAALLLGIAIGVGIKLGFDLLMGQKVSSVQETPKTQTNQEKLPPTDQNSLPPNFPKDFPLYSGSKLKTSWTTQGELREGISVLWESGDTPQKVAAFYKEKLPELGWSVNSSFESEGSYTISFEKDTSDGFVGITSGEGGVTQISVTLGIEIINI